MFLDPENAVFQLLGEALRLCVRVLGLVLEVSEVAALDIAQDLLNSVLVDWLLPVGGSAGEARQAVVPG